jgi:glycosyltransferase involved in cell wall biosynthesis
MNVFVLPSWYPSRRQPMAGLFVRDQARALALVRPGWNVIVGGWGHHDGALSLRSAGDSLRALAWRARAQPGWQADAGAGADADAGAGADAGADATSGPLHELLTPRLSWTLALAQGGARGLLAASRRNVALAETRFGRVDVVHAHVGFPAGWVAAQLAAERGLPYVLTEHMSPFPFPALRDAQGGPVPALRLAFERAAATVAVSAALAERIRACGLPCSDVIPNAVDGARFAAGATPGVAADPTRFVFFTLGALVPQKGVDVLLRALAQLPPLPRPVELHIGGDGPERGALQALSATLGVQDRVHWLGALRPEQTPAHFARCDAFVLASRHETFGVVLAEALLSGKPVVATRCGGPEDIVTPANGLLVAPQDPAALAAAMQAVRANPARYDADTLRADAGARFGLRAVGERVATLCERVVAAPAVPGRQGVA